MKKKKKKKNKKYCLLQILLGTLSLVLLNPDMSCLSNRVDPDQLASSEANWSGSALFAIKCMNLYQQVGSSNLIGWKFEIDVAS